MCNTGGKAIEVRTAGTSTGVHCTTGTTLSGACAVASATVVGSIATSSVVTVRVNVNDGNIAMA
jgi:hypothetical protein